MPEWSFPISLPKFSDDEFQQKRDAYIAEHGYYVTAPRLEDIVHLRAPPEPTQREWDLFRTSQLARTNPARAELIVELLDKKRARRDRMLASPIPTWGKNLASVMTVFDDINDTLGTAGVLMRIAARLAPRIAARFMLGPIGWLFMAADIAGLFLNIVMLPFACITRKRAYERVRDLNPFSKKARVRRARRTRRKLAFSKGEVIELLQTTDNIFGIGLCLGPIVGFAWDIVSGTVRTAMGEEVHWGTPPSIPKHVKPALSVVRNSAALHGAGEEMSDEDHLAFMVALNGATQLIKPYVDDWHPLDRVDNFNALRFQAPRPQHPTTKFILEEVGIREGEAIGWPGMDKDLVQWEELWDHTQPTAAKRFMDYAVRNRRTNVGLCGCQNGDEFGMNMLTLLEGYDTVEYESDDIWAGYNSFFLNGCELGGCGSFAVGGRYHPFIKSHAIKFKDNYLIVTGVSRVYRPLGRTWFGTWITCRNCKIFVGPGMGPPGFQTWIQAAWVVDETGWLEQIRKRPIGLVTTGPPKPP